MIDQQRSLFAALRCPDCLGELRAGSINARPGHVDSLECLVCRAKFAVVDDIPRMLVPTARKAMAMNGRRGLEDTKVATARSFGFEWQRFPEMYPEWERNFLGYVAPRGPDFFEGKRVLDAGCGGGRHAFYAARYGAEVWAIDLSTAIEVARRNAGHAGKTAFIQADLERLPFAPESFDFVYSLGVLHHLPNAEDAFRSLVRALKPGGQILVYVYWRPASQPVKQLLLGLVAMTRRLTIRLPHRVTYALAFPAACLAFGLFLSPYRVLRASRIGALRRLAEMLPMRQYAAYPFRVFVNDQFDRFSAPIEQRFTRAEFHAWFERAGLEAIDVRPYWGWVGAGRKPGGPR